MATRANRRSQVAMWAGEQRDNLLDGFFSSLRDQAAHELGRTDIVIGSQAEHLIIGLPLPALSLRYLFQSTVYPLSRVAQLTGEEGSCKTAFLVEMARWHYMYGGGFVYGEAENKDAPEFRNSILRWNPVWLSRLDLVKCYVLEDWMDMLSTYVALASAQQDAVGGPGRTVPIMLGIDSLMSVAPREEVAKTVAEGHSMRGFALAANLIARYMRAIPKQIQNYPFSVVGTNHLKPSTDFMGRPTSTVPGGKSVKFMETFEIEMHKAPGCDIDRLDYGGIRIKFVMRKNSLGPGRKQIVAELLWWRPVDEVTGEVKQQTQWDWDTSTIELLLSFEEAKGKKTIFNNLMDIVDINANRKQRVATSRRLGVSEPTDYRVLGALLEEQPALLAQIYPLLGVSEHNIFQPALDYRRQLSQAAVDGAATTAEQIRQIRQSVGNAPVLHPEEFGPGAQLPVAPEDAVEDDDAQ